MRIGILTHPLGNNYGGILQNYALQQVLTLMGHQPVTLSFPQKQDWGYKILSLSKRFYLKCIRRQNIYYRGWLTTKERAIVLANNLDFINKYIDRKEIDALSSINMRRDGFDAVIVGSDQVWNKNLVQFDIREYFLKSISNPDIKKIAYAASFGTNKLNYTQEEIKDCASLLQRFKGVSVREKDGLDICNNVLGNTEAQLVLDPTMLLGIDDYLQLLDSKDYKEDVFMTYLLDRDERKLKVVRTIKECFNLPICNTLPEAEFQTVGPKEIDKCIYPGIKKWIEGFQNARFVVTDSFHGTALSIVFHKPFVSIQNNKRGGSRLESLLNMLGLRNRLIEQYNESEVREISHEEINWIEVDATLGLWREKSMSFLNNALQN